MAEPEVSKHAIPLADGDPCGPDLFEAGDPDFMHFMAHSEGLLPASFFDEDGKPFDRAKVDFKTAFSTAAPFLARTRDLRVLVLLAKFAVLNRDLDGFADYLRAIAELLEQQWDHVHPVAEGGDFTSRLASVQSLDDSATVVLPLQHVPLAKPARGAPVAIRAQFVAAGDVALREGEEQPDAAAIERALKECELSQLVEERDAAQIIADSLTAIRDITVERTGYAVAVKFERLHPLANKLIAFLNEAIERRDPSLTTKSPEPAAEHTSLNGAAGSEAARPAGDIGNIRQVAAALAAVEAYFCRLEPSNPALLLVRQAIQLIGKSFLEAVTILAPEFVDRAAIAIGRSDMFDVPLQKLAEFSSVEAPTAEAGETDAVFEARSRAEATSLMTAVVGFYGRSEPSSAIPFLIERARALAGRDFLSILKDILPENTLKNVR